VPGFGSVLDGLRQAAAGLPAAPLSPAALKAVVIDALPGLPDPDAVAGRLIDLLGTLRPGEAASPRLLMEQLLALLEGLADKLGIGPATAAFGTDPTAVLAGLAQAVNAAETELNRQNLLIGTGQVQATLGVPGGASVSFTLTIQPGQGLLPPKG
jgi:hypothetical protein